MQVKQLIAILALGGLTAGAFFYRESISSAYTKGKKKVQGKKTKLTKDTEKTPIDIPPVDQDTHPKNNKPAAPKDTPRFYDSTAIPIVPRVPHDTSTWLVNDRPKPQTRRRPTRTQQSRRTRTPPRPRPPTAREKHEKQKYGIDRRLLRSAREKQPSKRTIDERKQIEAEKARKTFDSRNISNW